MIGLGFGNFQSGVGGFDPDAQAFITAAGITGETQQAAINQLVLDLKGTGSTTNNTDVWNDLYALYPFCPIDGSTQTLAGYSYNLVNTATFQVTWFNSPSIDSAGVTFNGSNQYGDTGFDISTDFLSGMDSGMTLSKVSELSSGNGSYMGGFDGSTKIFQLVEAFGDEIGACNGFANVSFGSFINNINTIVRRSATELEGYEDGVSIGTNNTNVGTPSSGTANISLGGRSGSFLKNCKIGGGSAIHKGLPSNQVVDLYDSIEKFNTALGR